MSRSERELTRPFSWDQTFVRQTKVFPSARPRRSTHFAAVITGATPRPVASWPDAWLQLRCPSVCRPRQRSDSDKSARHCEQPCATARERRRFLFRHPRASTWL